MKASAEPVSDGLVVRVHPHGDYGSEWAWGCVAKPDPGEPTTALITLAIGAPPNGGRQALQKVLSEHGYTHMRWERRRDGRVHWTQAFRT